MEIAPVIIICSESEKQKRRPKRRTEHCTGSQSPIHVSPAVVMRVVGVNDRHHLRVRMNWKKTQGYDRNTLFSRGAHPLLLTVVWLTSAVVKNLNGTVVHGGIVVHWLLHGVLLSVLALVRRWSGLWGCRWLLHLLNTNCIGLLRISSGLLRRVVSSGLLSRVVSSRLLSRVVSRGGYRSVRVASCANSSSSTWVLIRTVSGVRTTNHLLGWPRHNQLLQHQLPCTAAKQAPLGRC